MEKSSMTFIKRFLGFALFIGCCIVADLFYIITRNLNIAGTIVLVGIILAVINVILTEVVFNTKPQFAFETKSETPQSVGMGAALALFFKNYFNFKGRATRSEFLWGEGLYLVVLCSIRLLGINPNSFTIDTIFYIEIIWGILLLGITLPMISLWIRRLHDIGKSGLYFFLLIIPVVNIIGIFKVVIPCALTISALKNKWGEPYTKA